MTPTDDPTMLTRIAAMTEELCAAYTELAGPVGPLGARQSRFQPFELRRHPNARGTIFAFAGMSHGFHMPVAEFAGVLGPLPAHLVFIKDFSQAWYQFGLYGVTSTRAETAACLLEHFQDLPRPWVFVGASSGGYGALRFGWELKVDQVVAFAPQTRITPEVFDRFGYPELNRARFDFSAPDNDLAQAFDGNNVPTDLYYGAQNPQDTADARAVAGLDAVHLHPVASDVHTIAGVLKEQRRLGPALRTAFETAAGNFPAAGAA